MGIGQGVARDGREAGWGSRNRFFPLARSLRSREALFAWRRAAAGWAPSAAKDRHGCPWQQLPAPSRLASLPPANILS